MTVLICAKCGQQRERANHSYCRLCAAIYAKNWRAGIRRARKPDHCTVEACKRPVHGKGICDLHRNRIRRTGKYTVQPRTIAPQRYKSVKVVGHPLACATTHRVYLHRLVLFNTLGFGNFACFWCGTTVRWRRGITTDALIPDHLDHDRHNNDPTNLVPSCNRCNAARNRLRLKAPLTSVYQRAGTDERVGS